MKAGCPRANSAASYFDGVICHPTTSAGSHFLEGYHWGYQCLGGIKNPTNRRPFLVDCRSVPGANFLKNPIQADRVPRLVVPNSNRRHKPDGSTTWPQAKLSAGGLATATRRARRAAPSNPSRGANKINKLRGLVANLLRFSCVGNVRLSLPPRFLHRRPEFDLTPWQRIVAIAPAHWRTS